MNNKLSLFFAPRGVAVIGASASPNKLSNGILRNMLQYGYQGKVYPVNPRAEQILDLPCYPDISHVPDPVDLAVVVVPAPATPDVIRACGERGIRAAVIISGGFKETGPEGAALERRCVEIAGRYGMRLIGPNCVGTMDLNTGLNTTFIQGMPERGGIAFVSQSGALAGGVVDYIRGKNVGFSHFASLGNEADVSETDMIAYLAGDPAVSVIAGYVESIRDGRRFMQAARQVTPCKPLVMLKAGRTQAGARAVSSHTGSLAGSYASYQAAFRQSGAIEAASIAELFDIAMALDDQPLPAGGRVALLTNAGGPAALASDSLSVNGIVLADLSQETREGLRRRLNPAAQVDNPVDMLGGAEPPEYAQGLERLLADPGVDAVVVILVPQALVNPAEVAQAIGEVAQNSHKTVLACFMGEASIGAARKVLHAHRVPMYVFPEAVGSVLGAMLRYASWLKKDSEPPVRLEDPQAVASARRALEQAGCERSLSEAYSRPLLAAYGIPLVPGGDAHSPQEAVEIARRVGFPVALKVISADILHKSDAGGIALNLGDAPAVEAAYQAMMARIAASHPHARLEGALVEAMAPNGTEVIVGMRRDPFFGPLMMFGLGGIYVELFGDVSFRVAPLNRSEALEMIRQTQAGRLLTGFRGQPPADLDAVVDCILRLGQLALDFPEIEEMEVNPLRVFPQGRGALALDARVILSGSGHSDAR